MNMKPNGRSRSALLLLLTIAAIPAFVLAAGNDAGDSFESVVRAHFEHWDNDHDGKVTLAEVDRLIPLGGIPADAAAAIAALYRYLVRHQHSGLTFEFLLQPPKGEGAPNFEKDFHAARARIAGVTRVLFTPGAPTLDAIRQGSLGDCFFLAPVGALVHRDPEFIRHKFVTYDDGSFDVKFPGDRREHYSRITDVQIAITSSEGKEGLWLTALELATGRKLQNELREEAREGRGKVNGIASIDSVAGGGSASLAMAELTGHKIVRIELTSRGSADAIRQAVETGRAHHCIICVGIEAFGEKAPPKLNLHHAYALLGYDQQKDAFLLWNPHGTTHHPEGPPGPVNGYVTEHGRFFMPVADFVRNVKGHISFETDVPVERIDPRAR